MARELMLAAILLAGSVTAAAARDRPLTIYVGQPTPDDIVYGPSDMLCDLNKCRLFNLPEALGLPKEAIVEFGLPLLQGQARIDLRRCFEDLCRASVLGYVSAPTSEPGHSKPTVFITPVEIRLL